MSVQNDITQNMRSALPGQLVDVDGSYVTQSYIAAVAPLSPEYDVLFGRGVQYADVAVNADLVQMIKTNTSVAVGMSIRVLDRETSTVGGDESRYKIGDTVSVLRRGRMYVIAAEAATAGDPVYLDISNTIVIPDGESNAGTVYRAATPTRIALLGAFWETDTPIGEIGIIILT